jgi:hypothetical protein
MGEPGPSDRDETGFGSVRVPASGFVVCPCDSGRGVFFQSGSGVCAANQMMRHHVVCVYLENLLSLSAISKMPAQIHGFDPNDFLPTPYQDDRRHMKEMVRYCGVRFRAAVREIQRMGDSDAKAIEPTFRKEMAGLQVI